MAERGRELDAREQQITERYQQSEREVDAQLALITVGGRLKEFENINWAAERAKCQGDPVELGDLNAKWIEFEELRSLHQEG